MAFEKFTEYGAAVREEATIRVSGYVFLPKAFIKRSFGQDPQGAALYTDKENGKIAIELLSQYDSSDRSIRKVTEENSGYALNILPLLQYLGIGKLKEKFCAVLAYEEGKIVLNVNDLIKAKQGQVVFPTE